MQDWQIALNRFGLGGSGANKPDRDARRWLLDQMAKYQPSPPAITALPGSKEAVGLLQQVREAREERKEAQAKVAEGMTPAANPEAQILKPLRDAYLAASSARNAAFVASETPFVDRLVAFWSNHFAVSIDKPAALGLAGAFENEAIRPHVLGKFSDMLFAVERHPGMLLYLDQAQSIGPGSMLAQRARQRGADKQPGLNENLAREILELHTLGVRTGYSQTDVTEFARALTGLTVSGLGRIARLLPGESGKAVFVPQLHEPGTRTVLGKRYEDNGEKQGLLILADLATHPATARHIATKLARHFAADDPPPALVTRLEESFRKTGGDLPSLYRVLIEAPEVWSSPAPKFRQPWEWLVSLQRASGVVLPALPLAFAQRELGQQTWKPGSPAGFDDTSAAWAAPDALLRRVEFANRYARSVPTTDARSLAPALFPGALGDMTAQSIARAETPAEALALLFVSPEMLRR